MLSLACLIILAANLLTEFTNSLLWQIVFPVVSSQLKENYKVEFMKNEAVGRDNNESMMSGWVNVGKMSCF